MTLTGEIARFKVLPAGRGTRHYWTVLVFRTKRSMRRAFHRLNATNDHDDRFGAIVMPQERQRLQKGRWRSDPSLGYALFARTQLDSDTQCHEAVHMALECLRRRRRSLRLGRQTNQTEEEIACAVGHCAGQLHRNFYKRRCYRGA